MVARLLMAASAANGAKPQLETAVDSPADAEKPEWGWKLYAPLAIFSVVVSCAGLLMYVYWSLFVDSVFEAVEADESKAVQALVINSILVIMIVGCLPGPAFCVILDGFFFGFSKGFVLGFTAELIGYLMCICLARTCFKTRMRQWMSANKVLHEVVMISEEDPTGKFLLFFRFLSIPVWMKNYTIGMLDLDWLKTILVFLPAETFYAGIFAYIGSKGYTIAKAIRKGDTQKALHSFSGFEFAIFDVTMIVAVMIIVFGWREYSSRRATISEGKRGELAPLAAAVGKPIV